jgi:hypothetical protein
MAQVVPAVLLSVAIRWGPVMTAVNSTLVARPARTIAVPGCAVGSAMAVG